MKGTGETIDTNAAFRHYFNTKWGEIGMGRGEERGSRGLGTKKSGGCGGLSLIDEPRVEKIGSQSFETRKSET